MPVYISAAEPSSVEDTEPFDARIVPNDSLGSRGFFIFAAVVLAFLSAVELTLAVLGHWMIAAFFLLDGGFLLIAAFLSRQDMQRSERIVISGGSVCISIFERERLVDQKRLMVFGISVEREDDPDFGCQSLSLVLRGRRYVVAAALAPHERGEFADKLVIAIREAGGCPTVRKIEHPPLLATEPSYAQ